MKIYVGNLDYSTTEDELKAEFSEYGTITDLKIIQDYNTGQSKGFGFITFSSADEMTAALEKNGQEVKGRKLRVNEARERERA